jgi:hypothetical protein
MVYFNWYISTVHKKQVVSNYKKAWTTWFMTISDIYLHTMYDMHIVLMCTMCIRVSMYTAVQQLNNYWLDTITLHCEEMKTLLIIYDRRNTKKIADTKYSNASETWVHKKTRTPTESCTQHRNYLDYWTSERTNWTLNNTDSENWDCTVLNFWWLNNCRHNYWRFWLQNMWHKLPTPHTLISEQVKLLYKNSMIEGREYFK